MTRPEALADFIRYMVPLLIRNGRNRSARAALLAAAIRKRNR
ncbi:hypothetical protein [Micromonospora sp. DT227]